MKLHRFSANRALRFSVVVAAFVALGCLFYWLLPVAAQSRLSADHVRRVFGVSDFEPVAGASLSGVWTSILIMIRELGFGSGEQTFATAAAVSGWLTLGALALLCKLVPWPALILLALTPTVLWSAVVPSGTAVHFLILAMLARFAHPGVTISENRKTWCAAAVFEGLACATSPAAWILVILRAAKQARADGLDLANRIRAELALRFVLFALGFTLPLALAAILGFQSFSALPVAAFIRSLQFEDQLGAALVLLGRGGETAIALSATFAFVVAITIGPAWAQGHDRKLTRITKWALLIVPYIVVATFGQPTAWRLAHPGWHTVFEDFAKNIDRSFASTVVAIVRTPTEEAAVRFHDAVISKDPHVIALRTLNIFEPSTLARVQARESRWSIEEARAASSSNERDGFEAFIENLILPNLKRGVVIWMDTLPDRSKELDIQFLGNGFALRSSSAATEFKFNRDALKATMIRAHVGYREFLAGRSVEVQIFERYATYHLATARVFEKEKRTSDWQNRARAENYAALKKVEWLREPYQVVCEQTAREAGSSPMATGTTSPEPLDICVELKKFYEPK